MEEENEASYRSLNWTAVAALYTGLLIGLVATIYWGDYRNAAWLGLIGTGGALTAYGRVLEECGQEVRAQRWQWGAGVAYAVFFVWAGTVLIWVWMGS